MKQEDNPISAIFSDLTTNQKMSVLNLLITIGVCDGERGSQDKELQYLNNYVKILGVRSDSSMAYFESLGHERMIEDLEPLPKKQKEFLVIAAWEMITCDGRPNETELEVAGAIFNKIGVTDEQFVATIEKSKALMKHFFEK
ncbi:MAG: hypothetical protein JJU13_08345 [Balneolaceae bacterium]|nr:hypothetical protein [Balneolaceae bacterium]